VPPAAPAAAASVQSPPVPPAAPAGAPPVTALTLEQFLAANPAAAAEHRKRADAAAAKAVADKEAELARQAAERDMTEAEKAKAETKRERERADAERKRADEYEVQLGFAQALVAGGHQLAGDTAKGMLQMAAAKKIADAKAAGYKLEWADAIKSAISESPFLVKPAAAAAAEQQPEAGGVGTPAGQNPQQNAPQGAAPTFGAPAPRPPAAPKPEAPVDTSTMTPEARQQYKQERYGIG